MNKSRIAARLVLPAVFAATVVGGTVAPASADPTTTQNRQDLTRELQDDGPVVGGLLGSLGGQDGLVGGLVSSLLGQGGLVDGLL